MKRLMVGLLILFLCVVKVAAQKSILPLDLTKKDLKVLDIGNSYTEDATAYLKLIAEASGSDLSDMCLYKLMAGYASFRNWYNTATDSNPHTYSFRKVLGGINVVTPEKNATNDYGTLIRSVLKDNEWDLILIHQVSAYAPYFSQWAGKGSGGYLNEFIQLLKDYQPSAKIGMLLIHSYWSGYSANSEKSHLDRWELIAKSVKEFTEAYDCSLIIPYGTAVENLRASSLNNEYDLTRDGVHLGYGLARYTAACTYYQALIAPRSGISVIGNPSRFEVKNPQQVMYPSSCVNVTDENVEIAQNAALLAIENPYEISFLEDSDVVKLDTEISTFCSDKDLDFSHVEGVNAYVASQYKVDKGVVIMKKTNAVPARTGVVLKGIPGSYNVPHGKGNTIVSNMLKGTTKLSSVEPVEGKYTNFYFDGNSSFSLVTNTIADVINKAYLQIPTSFLDNKTSIKMIFDDDDVYDINGDGVVDISDITILVNDVLNK